MNEFADVTQHAILGSPLPPARIGGGPHGEQVVTSSEMVWNTAMLAIAIGYGPVHAVVQHYIHQDPYEVEYLCSMV